MDGTVDGTPFSGAVFTAVATSDGPTLGGGGYTVYPSTLTFDIAGIGTSLPLTGAYAITIGPPQMLTYAAYAVELSASGATVTGFFNAMANVICPPGAWRRCSRRRRRSRGCRSRQPGRSSCRWRTVAR